MILKYININLPRLCSLKKQMIDFKIKNSHRNTILAFPIILKIKCAKAKS